MVLVLSHSVFLTHKTKENGDDISITDTGCNCSPITAFEHHLASNTLLPPSAPMFAFEMGEDTWSPMRRSWFLAWCH